MSLALPFLTKMPFEVLEHTSDYQIRVLGKDLAELFSSALAGMNDFLTSGQGPLELRVKRELKIKAANPTLLLIDFLSAVLQKSQSLKEIYPQVKFQELTEQELAATLTGAKVSRFADEIKAATYHRAGIKKNQDQWWETEIVFDL